MKNRYYLPAIHNYKRYYKQVFVEKNGANIYISMPQPGERSFFWLRLFVPPMFVKILNPIYLWYDSLRENKN